MIEIAREPAPGLEAARHRTIDAVNADELRPAQNERRDRHRQVHALGEAAGRDHAAAHQAGQRIGERMRADAVDRRGPALLAERPAGRRKLGAIDDLRGAESPEVVGLGAAPGRSDDPPSRRRQQRNGDRADAAGRARDENRPLLRRGALALQREHAKHRRIAGGADRHRLSARQAGRHLNQPFARHAGLFGIAAIVRLAEPVTVDENFVARPEVRALGGLHDPRKVDAGDHRIALNDAGPSGHNPILQEPLIMEGLDLIGFLL